MITLFDQGYAVDAYAKELARKHAKKANEQGQIQAAVETYQEMGLDFSGTVEKLSSKYGLSREKAAEYVEKYRQKAD